MEPEKAGIVNKATATADAMSTTPRGVLSRRPQGMFLSTAMTAPSPNIHPTLPMPTTNISSMSDQQHPTQKSP